MDPDDDLLAERGRERREAEVSRPIVVHDGDPTVLGVPPLDDVEIRDDLQSADDRRRHRRLDEQDVLELPVDPVPDAQAVLLRIEMDIGGLAVARLDQDVVDELRERRGDGLLLQVLADVAMMLRAIGRKGAGGDGHDGAGGRARLAVVAGEQAAESLEGQLIQQVGRDQVELEDRLPQVAIVLLTVDLREPDLLRREQALLQQDADQRLLGRGKTLQQRLGGTRGAAIRANERSSTALGRMRRGGRSFHVAELLGVRSGRASRPGEPKSDY